MEEAVTFRNKNDETLFGVVSLPEKPLEEKTGVAMVGVHAETSVGRIHTVLRTCESSPVRAWLFSFE